MARPYYIAGNWNMHKTRPEAARAIIAGLKNGARKYMIAPSFRPLETRAPIRNETGVLLGAQNCAEEEQGAHTGALSVLQLKELGMRAVILGHSERRHLYKEDYALVNKKLRPALAHGFEAVLCVVDLLSEREAGPAKAVCER